MPRTAASPTESQFAERIAAVRRFNRFYTRKIGVLNRYLQQTRFSLSETRVIYELNNREAPTASDLVRDLGFDAGYLSRILRRFERDGLLRRERSESDGRQVHLYPTEACRRLFADLNAQSKREVGGLLSRLSDAEQRRLTEAMATVERLLGAETEPQVPLALRPHRPGDIGWVISAHGRLYAEEYGWDNTFEALAAEIAGRFLKEFDPACERCWIAELGAERVGAVFLVKQSDAVAKLRMLIVDPAARGRGLGRRLVEECLAFARQCGYRRMVLWTNSILLPARRIYEDLGFRLTASEPHHSFGVDLVGETWEIDL